MTEPMTLIEKTVFLKSIESLSEISTEALAHLAASAAELRVPAGEVLFEQGDPDRGTFIVIEGRVELERGDAVVRVLHAGSAHGEFFVEGDEGHQFRGVALEDVHALNIQRDDVMSAALDFPEIGLAIVRAHAIAARRMSQRVLELEAELKRCMAALENAGIRLPETEPPDTEAGD